MKTKIGLGLVSVIFLCSTVGALAEEAATKPVHPHRTPPAQCAPIVQACKASKVERCFRAVLKGEAPEVNVDATVVQQCKAAIQQRRAEWKAKHEEGN